MFVCRSGWWWCNVWINMNIMYHAFIYGFLVYISTLFEPKNRSMSVLRYWHIGVMLRLGQFIYFHLTNEPILFRQFVISFMRSFMPYFKYVWFVTRGYQFRAKTNSTTLKPIFWSLTRSFFAGTEIIRKLFFSS